MKIKSLCKLRVLPVSGKKSKLRTLSKLMSKWERLLKKKKENNKIHIVSNVNHFGKKKVNKLGMLTNFNKLFKYVWISLRIS